MSRVPTGTAATVPHRAPARDLWFLAAGATTLVLTEIVYLSAFGLRYATEDQALLWYAQRELGRGRLHQPAYYGQSYGTMFEAIPAGVLRLLTPLGTAPSQAAATAMLAVAAATSVSFALWRAHKPVAAALMLASPGLLSGAYLVLSQAPRGFALSPVMACVAAVILIRDPAASRRVAAFSLLSAIAVVWDATCAFIAVPLGVFALCAWVRLGARALITRLALAAGAALPAAAWMAYVTAYFRAHPLDRTYAPPGLLPRWSNLASSLAHLPRFFDFFTPGLWNWAALPLAALVAGAAASVWTRQPSRFLPVLALLAMILAAIATDKAEDFTGQPFLGRSRFLLTLPLAAGLLWAALGPTIDARRLPARRLPARRLAARRLAAWPTVPAFGLGALVLAGAVSVATLPGRLDDVAAATLPRRGVTLERVGAIRAQCAGLAATARAARTNLVFVSEANIAYGCPVFAGGQIDTLRVLVERRAWRFRSELNQRRRSAVFAVHFGSICDRAQLLGWTCRPSPPPAGLAQPVFSVTIPAAQPAQNGIEMASRLGVVIPDFETGRRTPAGRAVPSACVITAPPALGAPPSRDPNVAAPSLLADIRAVVDRTRSDGRKPFRIRVRVTNRGSEAWPFNPDGGASTRLGVHLLDVQGRLLVMDWVREDLLDEAGTVAPGHSVTLDFPVLSPPPGQFQFELDLVLDGRAWFAEHGSQTQRIAVETRC